MKKIFFPLLMLSTALNPLRFKSEDLTNRKTNEFRVNTKYLSAKKQNPADKLRHIIAGTADGF